MRGEWRHGGVWGVSRSPGVYRAPGNGALLLLLLLLFGGASTRASAAAAVYRCDTATGVVYTDIGCTASAPMRLGRPVGSIDPLTEGERALLEQLRRDLTARRPARPATRPVRASAKRCRGTHARSAECSTAPDARPAKPRSQPRKPSVITHRPAPARAMGLGRRAANNRSGGDRPAAPSAGPPGATAPERQVAPGRLRQR